MHYSTLIICVLFSSVAFSQVDLQPHLVIPNHYIVTKTNAQLKIDGKADEPEWQNASFTTPFIDIQGIETPKYSAKVKMLWDEKYIYLYAYIEEPHVWATLKQRDTIIFYNNDFEVFIDPSGDTRNYGEIEINALGTIWDLVLDKPYRVGGKANNHWNLTDLKTAVYIDGSLNDASDTDNYWSVEMAIPMDALIELRNKPRTLPKEGEQWRINFSRVHWDHDIINGNYYRKKENGKYLREYNWVWSNQKVINMHEPEKWGYLQFTHKNFAESLEFIIDKDQLIKQSAYALFRLTRFGKLKYLNKTDVNTYKELEVRISGNNIMNVSFYKTNFGFEYKIRSPYTNKVYLINEDGFLKSL